MSFRLLNISGRWMQLFEPNWDDIDTINRVLIQSFPAVCIAIIGIAIYFLALRPYIEILRYSGRWPTKRMHHAESFQSAKAAEALLFAITYGDLDNKSIEKLIHKLTESFNRQKMNMNWRIKQYLELPIEKQRQIDFNHSRIYKKEFHLEIWKNMLQTTEFPLDLRIKLNLVYKKMVGLSMPLDIHINRMI